MTAPARLSPETPDSKGASSSPREGNGAGRARSGLHRACGTVLVVDDDASIRETVSDVLEDEGYHVLRAENGQKALELLEKSRPNLMLLDLMMPVMSGWEVLEVLSENDELAAIPVVVVSAMLAPGARMCLQKPVDLGHLLQVVEHYCGMVS